MRNVVLIDLKIDKDEALALLDEYAEFIEEHTKMKCEFYVERRDFSQVPTARDGDTLRPTFKYRQDLSTDVHKRYGDYGTDNIIMWVHEDNFLYKGVWGTAWSYTHYKYNFLLCRWDKDNPVNTFNTLFHEGEHPHDTVIKRELEIDVNPLIANWLKKKSFDYDSGYVHGKSNNFMYIGRRGYERDGRMLEFLAPYLRGAYGKRKEKHNRRVTLLTSTVEILRRIVSLLTTVHKRNKT